MWKQCLGKGSRTLLCDALFVFSATFFKLKEPCGFGCYYSIMSVTALVLTSEQTDESRISAQLKVGFCETCMPSVFDCFRIAQGFYCHPEL